MKGFKKWLVLTAVVLSMVMAFGACGEKAGPAKTAPGAPVYSALSENDGAVTLSWDAPANSGGAAVSGYEVSIGDGGAWVLIGVKKSHTFTGLTNGTQYTVKVRAINEKGAGAVLQKTAVPGAVPSAPVNLSAEAGDKEIVLSWTAPANSGGFDITGYEVRELTKDAAATWTPVNALTYTFSDLTNDTEYTFNVRAVNAKGKGAEASAVAKPEALAAGTPKAVGGLSAAAGDGQVVLSWTAPANDGGSAVTGYKVTNDNGVTWIPVSALTYTFSSLDNGINYAFSVRAINANGDGASVSVSATPASVPSAPTELKVSAGDKTAALSWGAPADNGGSAVKGYKVSGDGTNFITVTGLSHTFTGLTNDTEYTFTVAAVNAAGAGAAASVKATPKAPSTDYAQSAVDEIESRLGDILNAGFFNLDGKENAEEFEGVFSNFTGDVTDVAVKAMKAAGVTTLELNEILDILNIDFAEADGMAAVLELAFDAAAGATVSSNKIAGFIYETLKGIKPVAETFSAELKSALKNAGMFDPVAQTDENGEVIKDGEGEIIYNPPAINEESFDAFTDTVLGGIDDALSASKNDFVNAFTAMVSIGRIGSQSDMILSLLSEGFNGANEFADAAMSQKADILETLNILDSSAITAIVGMAKAVYAPQAASGATNQWEEEISWREEDIVWWNNRLKSDRTALEYFKAQLLEAQNAEEPDANIISNINSQIEWYEDDIADGESRISEHERIIPNLEDKIADFNLSSYITKVKNALESLKADANTGIKMAKAAISSVTSSDMTVLYEAVLGENPNPDAVVIFLGKVINTAFKSSGALDKADILKAAKTIFVNLFGTDEAEYEDYIGEDTGYMVDSMLWAAAELNKLSLTVTAKIPEGLEENDNYWFISDMLYMANDMIPPSVALYRQRLEAYGYTLVLIEGEDTGLGEFFGAETAAGIGRWNIIFADEDLGLEVVVGNMFTCPDSDTAEKLDDFVWQNSLGLYKNGDFSDPYSEEGSEADRIRDAYRASEFVGFFNSENVWRIFRGWGL
jgi:hypothetical protein